MRRWRRPRGWWRWWVPAGQGTNVGRTFEELAALIERIADPDRAGVCLDTCHLFAAGYDLRTREGYERMLDEFDATVGLRYLRGWHLNDSRGDLGSRVDRHAAIGAGLIGRRAVHVDRAGPALRRDAADPGDARARALAKEIAELQRLAAPVVQG